MKSSEYLICFASKSTYHFAKKKIVRVQFTHTVSMRVLMRIGDISVDEIA